MITTTTSSLEGHRITSYLGLVAAEAIVPCVREFFSAVTRVMGERNETPDTKLAAARETVLRQIEERAATMGADAVIDLRLRFTQANELILLASATGTAVKIE